MAIRFFPLLRWDVQPGACPECQAKSDTTVALWETFNPAPPLHPHCRCRVRLTLRGRRTRRP